MTDLYNEVGEVVPLGQIVQQQFVRDVEADLLVPELEVVDPESGAHCGAGFVRLISFLATKSLGGSVLWATSHSPTRPVLTHVL